MYSVYVNAHYDVVDYMSYRRESPFEKFGKS